MADPNYWPHTGQMARRTLGDMRTFVARSVVGKSFDTVPAHQQAEIDKAINQEVEEWRGRFPGVQGFAQQVATLDYPKDQTRIELPADYGEFESGGRAILLDANGEEVDRLEVVMRQAWDHDLQMDAIRPKYDYRQNPIAYLHGVSENGRRMLALRPQPSSDMKVRMYYFGHAQVLNAAGDELEAPIGMHGGIEHGAASRFALFMGSDKWQAFRLESERSAKTYDGASRSEVKRPGRMLSFHEAGGYSAFEFPDRPGQSTVR